jgi:hypothetical protein
MEVQLVTYLKNECIIHVDKIKTSYIRQCLIMGEYFSTFYTCS